MKKQKLILTGVLLCSMTLASQSMAVPILSFGINNTGSNQQSVLRGDTVTVDLNISELNAIDDLGAFSFDLISTSSVPGLGGIGFGGDQFTITSLDIDPDNHLGDATTSIGPAPLGPIPVLNGYDGFYFDAVSWILDPSDPIFQNQPDTFKLLSFEMRADQLGLTNFFAQNVVLSDSHGNDISDSLSLIDPVNGLAAFGQVNVIPEPSSFILLGSGTGLLCLFSFNRKRKKYPESVA